MIEQKEQLIGLRNLRRSLGLSQAELAEKVGVGQDAISHYERGIRFPTPKHLRLLAETLHCNIPDLFREQPLSAPKEPPRSRQHLGRMVQDWGGSGYWVMTTDELKKAAGSAFELRNMVRQLASTQRIVRDRLAEGGVERADRKALQQIAKQYTNKLVALSMRAEAVLEAEARELTAELELAMNLEQEVRA